MGFSRAMNLVCSECSNRKTVHSSPKINDQCGFKMNKLAVLYTHEIGGGYASLTKLASVFGMPNMNESTYHDLKKRVSSIITTTGLSTREMVTDIVKENYIDLMPNQRPDSDGTMWDEDDGVPWIDVSFDGTWHKRGHTSHYGVGFIIDAMTGYVIDFEVMSSYCHICAVNASKVQNMEDADREAWQREHLPSCDINHEGSSKSMEKAAAVILWGRSVARYNVRYRTMLDDGDSVAFNAVQELQPYGPTRPVTKLECVNHVHKRMGTALRNAAKEERLGGRGQGRLTLDKCTRLQYYFRGAVLDNLRSVEAMKRAIWATFFHCTSTDEDPHHNQCPAGEDSWCFVRRSEARGEQPEAHEENVGTALSRDVASALIPIYRRFTAPVLLKRTQHGQTQNANESLHSLVWHYCPKTAFVGKTRFEAAVHHAVSKFNRGNQHLALVMENMNIPSTEETRRLLDQEDQKRLHKAEAAARETGATRRQARRAKRREDLVQQEAREGHTYGPGLMEDR